jgi:hypothetical protein
VIVNQQGSMDELNHEASEEYMESDQEVQSQDKEDLQLIIPEKTEEMPNWVQPFDSQQLRDLLKVAMQGAQSNVWWQTKPIVTSTFSLEGSSSHELSLPREASDFLVPTSQALVIAPRKQIITKVYTRRRFKEEKEVASPPKNPVFADTAPEYETQDNKKAAKATARKRKPTSASETNLRRSKRNKALNDGYKPTSPVTTRKRATMKKLANAHSSLPGKSPFSPSFI